MKQDKLGNLISLFFSTSQIIRGRLHRYGKIDPFSHLQLETLQFIEKRKSCNMKEVAEYLHISAPSATSLVNNLVKFGWLKRVHDKQDRRVVNLVITDKGKKMVSDGSAHTNECMREILSALNNKEISDFAKILYKLSEDNSKK